MKKLLSILLVSVLSLSMFAVTASADNVILLDPQQGDVLTKDLSTDTSYFTHTIDDTTGLVTGRTIDASSVTTATTIAKHENNTFNYRTFSSTTSPYTFDGGSARFKNNFTWEFDFNFSLPPATGGTNGAFQILFGDNWSNAIQILSVSSDTSKYYIRWGDSRDNALTAISAPDSGGWWYAASKYNLEKDKTYRLKIEVDVRNNMIYTTFTNPYVTVVNGTVTKLDAAEWDNPNIYTKTTSTNSSLSLGFTQSELSAVQSATNRLKVVLQPKSGIKLETSNEKFYIDRFWSMTPEVATDGSSVTATANVINVTNFKYYAYMPALICAVYKDDQLVSYDKSMPYASATATLTDYNYTASVDTTELADGTYTVKAFVWNTLDKMQPYDNCLVEKTLTVSGGVATLN